jgi:hypothetical protein
LPLQGFNTAKQNRADSNLTLANLLLLIPGRRRGAEGQEIAGRKS